MSQNPTEHHTDIDGHRIAYRQQGEGSPVILIHGIPTSSLMSLETGTENISVSSANVL